jgi:hypothetical protein
MSNLTPLVVSYKTEMAHCRSDAIRLRVSLIRLPTDEAALPVGSNSL